MKNRTLLVLAGIFIVLLIISVIQSNRVIAPTLNGTPGSSNSPADAALNNPNRLFQDFGPTEVVGFSMLDPDTGATFSLLREGNAWNSLEFGSGLDSSVAGSLVLTAAVLPYLEKVSDIQPENYGDFGLTQERAFLVLGIVLRNGGQHGVIIGDVAPGNTGHYALVDDRPEVYLLDARPIAYMVSYLRQIYLPATATPVATATSGG